MSYIVYRTINIIDQKYYIGVTNGNKPSYLGSGKALLNAIKEHGRENFVRETLEEFKTEEEAYRREAQLVDDTVVNDRRSYNIGRGGRGGPGQPKSKEHIEAIRKAIVANPSGGRPPAMDNALLIQEVSQYGFKGAASRLGLTFHQCRDRYYRAKRNIATVA